MMTRVMVFVFTVVGLSSDRTRRSDSVGVARSGFKILWKRTEHKTMQGVTPKLYNTLAARRRTSQAHGAHGH